MTPERWLDVERLYPRGARARARAPRGVSWAACGPDSELLAEVRSLLATDGRDSSVSRTLGAAGSRPAAGLARTARLSSAGASGGTRSSNCWAPAAWARCTAPATRCSSGDVALKVLFPA